MIAQEIADMLADAGAEPLGPVPNVDDAMRLIVAEGRIDGALLNTSATKESGPSWSS